MFFTADTPIKTDIYENFHHKKEDYYGDTLKSENLNFYENLIESLLDTNISSNVLNNTLKVYNSIPSYISKNIGLNDIYNSNNGTIVMDFEIDFDNVFSIEIGKNEIGYFSEINAKRAFFCECVEIQNTSLKQLNTDLESFYANFYDA